MSTRFRCCCAFGLALLLTSCGALGQFDTDVSADGVIPGSLSSGPGFPNGVDASGSLSQSFDSKGVAIGHISSVKLKAGTLSTPDSGPNAHLGYLKSFDLMVSANGIPAQRLGHIDEATFASKPTSATLILDDVELKPFLAAGGMTVTPDIQSASRPVGNVNIHVALTFHVVPQL
jgi:hypothetical protein